MNDTKYTIQNPELMSNCSTNLTEFYNTSENLDRNSKWNLILYTQMPHKNFIFEFNPFENVAENYNLNYIPIESIFQIRDYFFDFFPKINKSFKAKIEQLVKYFIFKSDFGYFANINILFEPAYPYIIVYSWSYISFTEALSRLGGILKIISYLRYLYIFEEYDYDKFHYDILIKGFEHDIKEGKKDKNKFIKFKHEIQANHTADEIYKKKNSIKNETYKDIIIITNENPKVYIKEKLKESKSKSCQCINNIENDYETFLIPNSLKKKDNIYRKIIYDFDNLSVWEWFQMKISICKCCRFNEKKIRFYNYLNENLNIINLIKNEEKKKNYQRFDADLFKP